MSEPAKKKKPGLSFEGTLRGLTHTPRDAWYQILEPSGRVISVRLWLPRGQEWNHLDIETADELPEIDLIDLGIGSTERRRLPIDPEEGKDILKQFWSHTHEDHEPSEDLFQVMIPEPSNQNGGRFSMARSRNRMAKGNTRKGSRKGSRKASRKTQSGGRKMSDWNKSVKRVYEEMKRKNRKASFSDALKEASKRKKAGNL